MTEAVNEMMRSNVIRSIFGDRAAFFEQNYTRAGQKFMDTMFNDFLAHKRKKDINENFDEDYFKFNKPINNERHIEEYKNEEKSEKLLSPEKKIIMTKRDIPAKIMTFRPLRMPAKANLIVKLQKTWNLFWKLLPKEFAQFLQFFI